MIILWSLCSFSFYVISYYVTEFPGSIYTNGILMGVADLTACFVSTILLKWINFKQIFFSSFSICLVVSLIFTFYNNSPEVGYICVFLLRHSITILFMLCFFVTSEIFSSNVKARVFSICNFFARALTLMAPMVAQAVPNAMLTITAACTIGVLSVNFLKA
jgi:hypothetical protein